MQRILHNKRLSIIFCLLLIVGSVCIFIGPSFVRATLVPHAVDAVYAPRLGTHTEKVTSDITTIFARIGIPATTNKASCISNSYVKSFTYHHLRETVNCEQYIYSKRVPATDALATSWEKNANDLQQTLDKHKWQRTLPDADASYDLRKPGNIYAVYHNKYERYFCHMNIEYIRDPEFENNLDYTNSTLVRYSINCTTMVSFFGGWNGLILKP